MKIISLGLGVQSTALCMMSSLGRIDRADHAIFADPGGELPQTYQILEYLTEACEDILHKMTYGVDGFKNMCAKFKKINTKMKKIKASYKLDPPKKEDADMIYTSEPYHFIIPANDGDNAAVMDLNTYLNGLEGWYGYH